MARNFSLPADYWTRVTITAQDVEFLQGHLFEIETPLTTHDLAAVFVRYRIKAERDLQSKQHQAGGKTYLPNGNYSIGEELVFPALDWAGGRVDAVRSGVNPELGPFSVITVGMRDGTQRLFASAFSAHALNQEESASGDEEDLNLDSVVEGHGGELEEKLQSSFEKDPALVKIAGRWFPRGLLVDVNQGHLNLAEAVLDMAQGEPQPPSALLKDVELPQGVNLKLAEFSLNYALQEDGRFDEVGPAGEVLWCLRRLEPEGVREVPLFLRYSPIEYDRSVLDEGLKQLETQLDDELSEPDGEEPRDIKEITISLIYPHLRAGTLPLSSRARGLFPTAYESPRVRFTLEDAKSGVKMPAWVVREHRYVFGLREWYKSHQLIPGSLVMVRRGKKPGEVIVEAKTQRSSKDWIRTLMVGADGGMVFAMLKQPITAEFNDRMVIYVPDFSALDPLWAKKGSFEELVASVMREITKLNPQGHVHAQELYAAVNLVRRVPPAPLFALLMSKDRFVHVGDMHFRLQEEK